MDMVYVSSPVRNELTLQFRRRGNWYVPVNPAAFDVCELAGCKQLPGSRRAVLERLGFEIEVKK